MNIVKHNPHWTEVDGRMVLTTANPAVIVTLEESLTFKFDDEIQEKCRAAARAAGIRCGWVSCHTVGGPVLGTVDARDRQVDNEPGQRPDPDPRKP